ncbi:uncharacterized protein LOC101238350 isoform X2 [Hydra vulgaris]|uniref:Uncharacterized protein LOC101238350 isoform X2 n=1 Tax=Hydra vulgaris TaxID=6087 RepID=A0ABM4CPW0_HYDVU
MACSLLVTLAVQWTCWISLNSVVTSLLLIKAENKAELLFLTGVEEYSFEIKNSGKIRLLKSINGGKSTLEIMELSIIELSEVYKNEHKINSIHSIFNISNVILNVSNESVIEKYGIAAVFRSLSIVMREDIRFNVDCIMYKSATRKKVSGANFLIKKGTVEFEISIKRLKFCGRNSTCMIKNQNETESFFNVVLETKAPYFTTITKNRFQFDNLDLIFSAMYRNSSGYSFNVDMENPNMISSSVGTTFTISLPSNKSEYYYSIVANENENMAPDIDTLFNNVSVQVRKQSGLTSILRTNKNNKRGKVLDIKIYSVEEVDRFGNKIEEKGHFIRNFSNQFFNISQVSKALKYGLIATVFNFTLFFENASISIEFIIFNSSGNILVESGETYNIVPGTMKFNIVIRDWIFCGTQKATCKTGIIGSYLDLQLEMKGAASKTRKTKETKLSNKFKVQKSLKSKYLPISFDIDQSTATFSSMVYINGNWTDMPVGFPRYNNINNDSLFIMRFPLSKSEIIYDPVIEVLPDGINSSAQLTFIPSIFFVIFFSLCIHYQSLA